MEQSNNPDHEFRETKRPLLRPGQVTSMQDDVRNIEHALTAPPHISSSIANRGHLMKRAVDIKRTLEKDAPRPYSMDEKDRAIAREKELRNQWLQGMPDQEEMRKKPPGAVDKHQSWDERNKGAIQEWKNIRLRLHAGGDVDGPRNARDVANIEMFRPQSNHSQQLSMDNAQIPGTKYYLPPPGSNPAVTFTDEEYKTLKTLTPDLASQLAILDYDARKDIKIMLHAMKNANRRIEGADKAIKAASLEKLEKVKRRAKRDTPREMTRRQQQSERMKKYWAAKKAGYSDPESHLRHTKEEKNDDD